MKTVKEVSINLITLIINQMLNTGIFPDKRKIDIIKPIFKKDDETLITNYRPKSLLPAISKVFANVIFKQIHQFFIAKKHFYNEQYGFRTGHLTKFAVLELVEMDKMNTSINIFLHLFNVFDTLDHILLLDKLD